MSPPQQKPRRSVQVVGTPRDFLDALEARWGALEFDLACTTDNMVAPYGYAWPDCDALAADWSTLPFTRLWLNPEFGQIRRWVRKCAVDRRPDQRIFFLTPAGISTNWFRDCVEPNARVYAINRMRFVGHEQDFPKDLMLSVFGEPKGFEVWQWRTKQSRKRA